VGGNGGGMFYAPYVNNTWTRVIKLSLGDTPGIAPDESFMIFTAKDLPGGYGHRELYSLVASRTRRHYLAGGINVELSFCYAADR